MTNIYLILEIKPLNNRKMEKITKVIRAEAHIYKSECKV